MKKLLLITMLLACINCPAQMIRTVPAPPKMDAATLEDRLTIRSDSLTIDSSANIIPVEYWQLQIWIYDILGRRISWPPPLNDLYVEIDIFIADTTHPEPIVTMSKRMRVK